MELAASQHEHYWTKGWLVVNDVFAIDEVERVACKANEVAEARLAAESGIGMCDRTADGELAPRKVDRPYDADPLFRDFVLNERLQALIEQLLGKTPLLVSDQIFMKPPRFGTAKPYHQDNYYFRCQPADDVITAWIALDDVDAENGCLRYIDGTHREPMKAHVQDPTEKHNLVIDDADIDRTRESLAIVRKGGVVFHHGETAHTSHRNESARWRRAYATHWATANTESDAATIRNAYFQRDDYPMPATV